VRVREVKSGRYDNCVDAGGRAASVDVGELYADEERRFLIHLDVPAAGADDDVTGLIKLSCNYRDAATGQAVNVAGDDAVVQRPVEEPSMEPSMEVEREQVRVAATEDMAAAQEAADRDEHSEGGRILRRRLKLMKSTAGDSKFRDLQVELYNLIDRVEDPDEYKMTGRACFLSGMSSHRQQRAGASMMQGRKNGTLESKRPPQAYATPAMAKMVNKSRKQRKNTEAPPQQQPKKKRRVKAQQPRDQSEPRKRHRKH
jgi:hypothetical protein